MFTTGFLGLVGLLALRTLGRWREGLVWMIVIAAIQDPVRKLVPGTPGWMALASVPVFFAMLAASMAGVRGWWAGFVRWNPTIGKLLLLFAMACFPAAAISATYSPGSWMLTLIGAMSYSVIFLGMIIGFHLAREPSDVRRMLAVYCFVHGAALSGALMEWSGAFQGMRVLGGDALGYKWVRHEWGYVVEMIAGFYRSADVMGWHAASVACFSLMLAYLSRGPRRLLWIGVLGVALLALILCGRRKMVFMLPVFLAALYWLYLIAGRSAKASSLVVFLALPAAGYSLVSGWIGEDSTQLRYYTETSDRTLDVFRNQGLVGVVETYRQSGFFGEGLGVATPGSHHIRVQRPRVWQESAPSRVLVELGVLGALGLAALLITIAVNLIRAARQEIRRRRERAILGPGLVAFFIANVSSLTVSGQILADPFIASFLGIGVGMALGFRRFEAQEDARMQSQSPAYMPLTPGGFEPR